MLGSDFFATGLEISKATNFCTVVALLCEELRPQIGAYDLVMLDVGEVDGSARVIGDGPVARLMRKEPDGVEYWLSMRARRHDDDPSGMCGQPTEEELASIPGLAGWLHGIQCTDIMGGSVVQGIYRSACVAAFRQGGRFSEEERERLQAAILVARCVLARIHNDVYDQRCLDRLLHTRREAIIAVFFVTDNRVLPYNPGAVAYSEACWGKDDVEHVLSDDAKAALHASLAGSWDTPVDSNWVNLELDIGGGPVEVGAIARPAGGAILLFAPPSKQTVSSGAVPMLTRRQCDIMDWIAEGKTSAEVAMILEISPRTVEKHLEAVFQRLGVENRVAAMRSYLEAKGGLPPQG